MLYSVLFRFGHIRRWDQCAAYILYSKMRDPGNEVDYLYQRTSRLEKKISLQSSNNAKTGETPHQDADDDQHGTVEDEVTGFHSSS